jgi:hypothetical protein
MPRAAHWSRRPHPSLQDPLSAGSLLLRLKELATNAAPLLLSAGFSFVHSKNILSPIFVFIHCTRLIIYLLPHLSDASAAESSHFRAFVSAI